eukprot:scaffold241120_cov33-Tisochrysis_lutea.AAC.6
MAASRPHRMKRSHRDARHLDAALPTQHLTLSLFCQQACSLHLSWRAARLAAQRRVDARRRRPRGAAALREA